MIDDLEAWAIGKLGLSRKQFDKISYRDLTYKIGAYLFRESKKMERTRYLAAVIINVNRPAKKAAISPEKLMKLPTDPKPKSVGQAVLDILNFVSK